MNQQESEVAKAAASGVAEGVLAPLRDFLLRLFGPTVDELGGRWGDRLRFLRFKGQITLLQRTRSFIEERGIEPKQVPWKVLLPLLEHGSLEENPDLQEKWAHLLAHACDSPSDIHVSFVEILRQLTPSQAKFLDALVKDAAEWVAEGHGSITDVHLARRIMTDRVFRTYELIHVWCSVGLSPFDMKTLTAVTTEPEVMANRLSELAKFGVALDNLLRMNLINTGLAIQAIHGVSRSSRDAAAVSLSLLGIEFVEVCKFGQAKSS